MMDTTNDAVAEHAKQIVKEREKMFIQSMEWHKGLLPESSGEGFVILINGDLLIDAYYFNDAGDEKYFESTNGLNKLTVDELNYFDWAWAELPF